MKTTKEKHPLIRGISLALMLGSSVALSLQVHAKDVTWDDIANDAQTTENVLGYGIGPKAQRYSPMTTVNRENVERLVPAWSFSFGDEKQRGQESIPGSTPWTPKPETNSGNTITACPRASARAATL